MNSAQYSMVDSSNSNKFLIARRVSQLSILAMFLLGPWFNIWIIKGNLNSSILLDTIPLTDPFIFLQTLFAGHIPELAAIQGAVLLAIIYMLLGGRVFCSWVCPLNMVTDLAYWLRRKINLRGGWSPSPQLRYWLLGAIFFMSVFSGYLVWETVNPVSMTHRGIIFGFGLAWVIIAMVFTFDLLIAPRGWCGHLCPSGAFYALLGEISPVRLNVAASRRERCDDCGDCYRTCPEPQVLKPALKGSSAIIKASACNNCGRCIDVCPPKVFSFTLTNKVLTKSTLQQVEPMETER